MRVAANADPIVMTTFWRGGAGDRPVAALVERVLSRALASAMPIRAERAAAA